MTQELISPERAAVFLAQNTVNRKLRTNIVRRYAEEMLQNAWTLTSDAIAFDEDGNLIQGQHRLSAVIQSQTTQPFWVARDMPVASRQNLDCGAKRELADRLTISGYDISRVDCAAVVRLMTPWTSKVPIKSQNPVARRKVKNIHNYLYEEFRLAAELGVHKVTACEHAALICYLSHTSCDNVERAKDFLALLKTGRRVDGTVDRGDGAVLAYRDIKMRNVNKTAVTMNFYRLAITASWNFALNEDKKSLRPHANNPFFELPSFAGLRRYL